MVWSCFTCCGLSELAFLEGRQDASAYCRTLQTPIMLCKIKIWKHCCISTRWCLLPNSTYHSEFYFRAICAGFGVTSALSGPQSNWKYVEHASEVGLQRWKTIFGRWQLKLVIFDEWKKIALEYMNIILRSMPRCCNYVILLKGLKLTIRYFLLVK